MTKEKYLCLESLIEKSSSNNKLKARRQLNIETERTKLKLDLKQMKHIMEQNMIQLEQLGLPKSESTSQSIRGTERRKPRPRMMSTDGKASRMTRKYKLNFLNGKFIKAFFKYKTKKWL